MIRNKPSQRDKGAVVAPRRNVIDMEQVDREIQDGVPGDVFNLLLRKGIVKESQRESFLKCWGSRRISLGTERCGFPLSFVRAKEYWRLAPTSALRQGPELLSYCYGVNEEISALRRVYLRKKTDFLSEDIARMVRRSIADDAWDILVAYVGANESGRYGFKKDFEQNPNQTFRDYQERVWVLDEWWYVNCNKICYTQSEEAKEIAHKANEHLNQLRADAKHDFDSVCEEVSDSIFS